MTDCIILGGGIIGMLTARELAQAGQKVVLLERGQVGREASWAGAGILSPLYPWLIPSPLEPLTRWSQAAYPELANEIEGQTGVDSEWTQCGLLIIDSASKSEARAWARKTANTVLQLDADQVRDIEPALTSLCGEALWLPEVAQIRNPRLLQGLRTSLQHAGVRILERTEACSLLTTGSRVRGLDTTQGEFHADRVVLAGGAWTGALLKGVGRELPIVPVRGQMIMYRAPPGLLRRMVLRHDTYLVPRRDGRILVGSTVEYVGFDKSATDEAKRKLEAAALSLVPGLVDYPIEAHWAGLRPGTVDGMPFIGAHPAMEGLYINAGHFRNGVSLAPASARLLADIMLRREPIVPPTPFALTNRV